MSEEMKIQLHRSEVQLTAEDAQEWLSTRLCPGIREIRAVELMERGAVIPEKQWNPPRDIRVVSLGGNTYIIDGQTRLKLQVMSGTTQKYNLIEYACKSFPQVFEVVSGMWSWAEDMG